MSIYQRNGIWHVAISVPGIPRVRRSTGTNNRQAAQEYHDRLKAQLWRSAKLGEQLDRTLDEAALRMLRLSEGQSDIASKKRHVNYWRTALGGQTPLRSLTADLILERLPTHTTHKHRKPTPVSAATKNRYLATMRRILNLASEWEWISRVPKIARFEEPSERVRWEPRPVILAFAQALSLEWMRDLCLAAVATGMREDELLSLEPKHIDLPQSNAWVVAENAKSGFARAVPLNADAKAIFERRIRTAQRYVFERRPRDGKEVRKISQNDARCFQRACAKIGLQDFHFHDLRHTWASWHVQSGTPLMVLKELGGWETIEMVQKYAHLAPSHLAHHAENVTILAHEKERRKKAA